MPHRCPGATVVAVAEDASYHKNNIPNTERINVDKVQDAQGRVRAADGYRNADYLLTGQNSGFFAKLFFSFIKRKTPL